MVKLNVKIVHEELLFQTMYEAWIDFEATHENLLKLDYYPKRHHAGRPRKDGLQVADAGNLTFKLKSGATVNVSPKGQPHRIQANWNATLKKEPQFSELKSVLVPFEGDEIVIVPVLSLTDDRDEVLDDYYRRGLI